MDADKLLKAAWTAVQNSGVPPELYEAAFNRAVDLLSESVAQPPIVPPNAPGKNPPRQQPAQQKTSGTGDDEAPGDAPSEDEFYDRIATETKVDKEQLRDLLNFSSTRPTINVTGRQLGSTLKQKQETIAVLIAVARQYGLHESTTSMDVIRRECERFKCADKNLSTWVRAINGVRLVGDKRVKDIQLRDAALDEFKAVAERILGKPESEA